MEKFGNDLDLAASILNNGGVIAFPTETVMGLGVIFDNEEAYKRLNIIKGRPESKPYTMMLKDKKDIDKYAVVSTNARKLIDKYMPGPITLLLKAKDNVPGYVTHNTGVIGIRIPDHQELLELLNKVGKPLLVPSANPSNQPPAKTFSEVLVYFKQCLDYIIHNDAEGKAPSTLVDIVNNEPVLLREGPISLEDILNSIKE